MQGLLIAFEGLDQSGKQTQAEAVRDHLTRMGRECRLLSFPDYGTPIGAEIGRALHGERDYPADVMQLLLQPSPESVSPSSQVSTPSRTKPSPHDAPRQPSKHSSV